MKLSILITGDFAPHGRVIDLIEKKKFNNFFSGLESVLKETDFNITNLECPLTSWNIGIEKTGPVIKAPESSAELLKSANFNVVTLANNHIMDYEFEGLKTTIEACKKNDIKTVGAGLSNKDLSAPLVLEKNGKKIGIINVAESEFSIIPGLKFGANPFDVSYLYNIINVLKNQVDKIIVIPHGGHEFYRYPSPEISKRYKLLIDFGADAVVAHHPHCFSGYEKYKKGLIFYSLGNFSFDWPRMNKPGWNTGFAVKLNLNENDELDFQLFPYKQGAEDPGVNALSEKEKELFFEELGVINKVISSEDLLKLKWDEWVKGKRHNYNTLIQPTNRIIKALQIRKMLPNIFFRVKRNRMMLYNLIRCESHREVLLEVLEEEKIN